MKTTTIFKLFILSVFIIINIKANSQITINPKKDINTKIKYANSLIWHFNSNINNLAFFQNNLTKWFDNPKRKKIDIPVFFYSKFTENKLKLDIDKTKNNIFNYDYHLDRLVQKVFYFNLQCQKIENLQNINQTKYVEQIFEILKTIENVSLEISEISYDFSRACAINFKKEELPTQLKNIQEVVSQSKNLILALRNTNKNQAQDYLTMLDQSLLTLKNDLNLMELSLVIQTDLSLSELKILSLNVYEKAFEISAWGEQYLQSSFSNKGLKNLLHKAILEFNEGEGKMGCASAFNTIIDQSMKSYMFFTEEPNNIFAEKIEPKKITEEPNINIADKPKEIAEKEINLLSDQLNTQIISNNNSNIIITNNNPDSLKITIPIEAIKQIEKFDKKNINTLAGSLPNNLIILMDVSVSMKKSGMLPVLKKSISHILDVMRDTDKISLIAYSGKAKVLISGATKKDRNKINEILKELNSSGGADLSTALDSAYAIGADNFIDKGNNKLIIASDGVFGVTYSIIEIVETKTKDNFSLSVFQYNSSEETNNTKQLKYLSKIGNGSFRTIRNSTEALKIMMEEIKKEK